MPAMHRFVLATLVVSFLVVGPYAAAQVVTTTLQVGNNPAGAGVNSATNKIYVSNELCNTIPCPSPGTVSVIDGVTNQTRTVNVGINPESLVVNSVTNTIYVTNLCGNDPTCQSPGTVSVINGNTLAIQTVNVGYVPGDAAVNSVTNKIYVVNRCATSGIPSCTINGPGTITVIDGVTLVAQTVTVGWGPQAVAVDPSTNKIYVVNEFSPEGGNGTLTVIDGATLSTQSVDIGYMGLDVAVDAITNKIYVANLCGNDMSCNSDGTVSVIDGATLATQSVPVAYFPIGIAVDTVANKIYVANDCSDPSCASKPTVTVIDGATLSTAAVAVCTAPGDNPVGVEVNPLSHQIYLPCAGVSGGSNLTVTAIDGLTNTTTPIAVGDVPTNAAINTTTNTVYVPNYGDNTVSVIGGATTLQFVSVTPCRLVDTRPEYGGHGPIQGGTSENFTLPQLGGCNIPTNAAAYALNVTVIPNARLGFLTIWPTSQSLPGISLMNSLDGRIKANAATVQAGVNGAVSVYVNNTTNVLIDINGYYLPTGGSTLAFHTLAPCRVVDTRNPIGDLGGPFLAGNQKRDFPVLESSCIPQGVEAQAYSFNVTVVPHPTGQRLGFLTVWPAGETQPDVSTLNNLTGTIVANAAIVPAGAAGAISVFPNDNTDLLIDINGYFGPRAAGGLSLYPTPPCRVLDTRQNGGQGFVNQLTVPVATSPCGPGSAAQAYVLNATVVPEPTLGFLTLWADGQPQPDASTLNAKDGAITSNMAVVPTTNGLIDAYANGLTQLILDISSYFAP